MVFGEVDDSLVFGATMKQCRVGLGGNERTIHQNIDKLQNLLLRLAQFLIPIPGPKPNVLMGAGLLYLPAESLDLCAIPRKQRVSSG